MSKVLELETWKPCPGFEGYYEVSDLGNARSLHFSPARAVARGKDKTNYPTINVSKKGRRTAKTLHRLVCIAFHGPPPFEGAEAAHIDGDRNNAAASNLRWTTKKENHSHKKAHGTHQEGVRHPRAKLSLEAVAEIRQSTGLRAPMAEKYGVSMHTITDIRIGRRWTCAETPPDLSSRYTNNV